MKFRRIFSVFMAVCLFVALLPAGFASAKDEDEIKYTRLQPEVPILNKHIGTNDKFYDSMLLTSPYNLIELFGLKSYSQINTQNMTGQYNINLPSQTVIQQLKNFYDGLKVSASATLHNNIHKHYYCGIIPVTVVDFPIMTLNLGGQQQANFRGIFRQNESTPRMGNSKYAKLPRYWEIAGYLDFQAGNQKYAVDASCSCHNSYVGNPIVCFMDDVAPTIKSVGGNIISQKYFKEGDEITIDLNFSEPIRFADDLPRNLNIGIMIDGVSSDKYPQAKLQSLNNTQMHFSYVVEEGIKDSPINFLDLKGLFADEIDLVQVNKDSTFKVKAPDGVSEETGFTKTTSYITDLAGNALTVETKETGMNDAYIDTTAPTVGKISATTQLHNTTVKEALGKTDTTAGNYLDRSDSFLGVGDTITYSMEMSEVINIHSDGRDTDATSLEAFTGLTVKTNLSKNGEPVILKSKYAKRCNIKDTSKNTDSAQNPDTTESQGIKEKFITYIEFEPITVTDDMTCSDEKNQIKLIELDFGDHDIKDFAKNDFSSAGFIDKNTLIYYLDVDSPEISTSAHYENDKYTVTIENDENVKCQGFNFQFKIEDSGTAISGTDGLLGKFKWNFPDRNVPFEYTVTSQSAGIDNNAVWTRGTTNMLQTFTQVNNDQYLHIRTVDNIEYGIYESSISLYASDLAGNNTDSSDNTFAIDWKYDNSLPSAEIANVSRKLLNNGDKGGLLSVDIELKDYPLLSSAAYMWNDGNNPMADDSSWIVFTQPIEGVSSSNVTAQANVGKNELFYKNLWVSVTDAYGNNSIVSLGFLKYDLTQIQYSLSHSPKIQNHATLTIENLEAESGLLFMVPAGVKDEYFVRYFNAEKVNNELNNNVGSGNLFESNLNIFYSPFLTSSGPNWKRKKVEWDGLKYTISPASTTNNDYIASICTGLCMDEFDVSVIIGNEGAFAWENGELTAAGTEAYSIAQDSIHMRLVSAHETAPDAFTEAHVLTDQQSSTPKSSYPWYSYNDHDIMQICNTAEGITVYIQLGEDVNNWNYEDINFETSRVRFEDEKTHAKFSFPLPERSMVQTLVLPQYNYPSGFFKAYLDIDCYSGKDFSVPIKNFNETMVYTLFIDATTPSNDFAVSSILYTPYTIYNGMEYGEGRITTDCFSAADIIYMPLVNSKNTINVTVGGDNPAHAKYFEGAYNVKVWNTIENMDPEITNYYYACGIPNANGVAPISIVTVDTPSAAYPAMRNKGPSDIVLVENRVNTIGVQLFSVNGKTSEIKYYNIYPTKGNASGTVSFTTHETGGNVIDKGEVIFTPDDGAIMDKAHVYCVPRVDNVFGEKVEMLLDADGTYKTPMSAGDDVEYYIHIRDKYGNYILLYHPYEYGEIYYIKGPKIDKGAPIVKLESKDAHDGLFEATFRIDDDTLNSESVTDSGTENVKMPISTKLYFNSEYGESMNAENDREPVLTLDLGTEDSYSWQPTESETSGIYDVSAERMYDNNEGKYYYSVTVKGVVYYSEDIPVKTNFTLYMDATDDFGYTGTGSAEYLEAENVTPLAYTKESSSDGPQYLGNYHGNDMALRLTFNTPVQPTPSWICPNPSGFSAQQLDAFPITTDGVHTISYYDIFGRIYTQEIPVSILFEKSLNLSISTLNPTTGKVDITVSASDMGNGELLIFNRGKDGTVPIGPTGNLEMDTSAKEKAISVDENCIITICRYYKHYTYDELYKDGMVNSGDELNIHITNIMNSNFELIPHFYFEETGLEYDINSLPQGETKGGVKVWCTADRDLNAINGKASQIMLRKGDDSYNFEYSDGYNNISSLSIDLSELGVILADPEKAVCDETAPFVTAQIYGKRSDNYLPMESLSSTSSAEEISNAFNRINYVQGYGLKLSVDDDSNYKIVIKKDAPSSLSYNSAASDSIDGVSVEGNMIYVTKPTDFYAAVVDNASGETTANTDNYTYIAIKESDIKGWFDTTDPEATVEIVSVGLYRRIAYVTITDKSDNGTDRSDTAKLTFPYMEKETSGKYANKYKTEFYENGTKHIVFNDFVGNTAQKDIEITDIDITPMKSTVEWNPPFLSPDGKTVNTEKPTVGPVNKAVEANILCNLPIKTIYAKYSVDGINWVEDSTIAPGISWTEKADRVTVTFNKDNCGIQLVLVGSNEKMDTKTLFLPAGTIDTDAPEIIQTINYQYRSGAEKPYYAEIKLTPSKPVYCTNGGINGKLYDANNPLLLQRSGNFTKSYYFTDKAGNNCEAKVETSGIDTEGPVLTTNFEELLKLPITSDNVKIKFTTDEDCTIVYDNNQDALVAGASKELTFTENGMFTVSAFDKAGNISNKSVVIGNIDKVLPKITFSSQTLSICQDSDADEVSQQLADGVNVWDNNLVKAPLWNFDASKVEINTPGLYEVVYTATDEAGNKSSASRFVKVYDKNQPAILIDGEKTEMKGTFVLSCGEHILKVKNLKEIFPGLPEPYFVKICKGICTDGQSKYFKSVADIDKEGNFTISESGFYTLYLITQSRISYIVRLYVENEK